MWTSIIWKASQKWLFEVELYKLNDFSEKKFKQVDDKAFWTHWQVISPEPLAKAIEFVFEKVWKKIPVLYFTPTWKILTQKKVELFAKKLDEFVIICGHYEWIDQRIIDLYVDYEISIGKYILTSWELASQVFIDSIVRFIPWVLWNNKSLEEESFSKKLFWKKEYPHYTKPRNFKWLNVPKVLLNWNHKEISKWKTDNLK